MDIPYSMTERAGKRRREWKEEKGGKSKEACFTFSNPMHLHSHNILTKEMTNYQDAQ
jgi:hypothetical protein